MIFSGGFASLGWTGRRFGNVELLKMLKRAGGDPGITNALGLTPLSYTCAFKLSLSKNGDDSWERQQVQNRA